jgi:cytidylate kinase
LSDIIAIDGPAGAGKSTVARRVANLLGYTYLDTGAMYRSVALQALENRIDSRDEASLIEIAQNISIEFGPLAQDGTQTVRVNGLDATEAIRTPEVSNITSAISAFSSVRKLIVVQQREIAARAPMGVVLEGRDIGTVVFPNASLKVFLTATAEERAKRRAADLSNRGILADFSQVLQDQLDRDSRDSSRLASPLAAAADAVHINTDGLNVDAVVGRILELHRERMPATRIAANETTDVC